MIKKMRDGGYVMDEVVRPTLTTFKLRKAERLTLKVGGDQPMRTICASCGLNERPDIFSVQASGPGLKHVWICDDCAEKFCPELLAEAKRQRAEWGKEHPLPEDL